MARGRKERYYCEKQQMSIACSRGHANIELYDTRIMDRLPNSMSFVSCEMRRAKESESGTSRHRSMH